MEEMPHQGGGMSLGSLMAEMAFATAGTAAVHALAYPLGGEFNIPHGEANTVMLKSVMEFDRDRCAKKMSRLARAVSMERLNMSDEEASEYLTEWMTGTARRIGVTIRIRDLGVPEDAIPTMADAASREARLLSNNPKTINREDIDKIYRRAW